MKAKMIGFALVMMTAILLNACSPAAESTTDNNLQPPIVQVPAGPGTSESITTAPTASTTEEVGFEEIVLVDNSDMLFQISAVENDPLWGYTLKLYIENRTEKDLTFTVENVSVNGFMCDPFWAASVTAGKKSNSNLFWFESSFAQNGITDVNEICFTLQVYDSNDFTADDLLREDFVINP